MSELTEVERTELEMSLRWHFRCHAAEPHESYASLGIENAVGIVERILTARLSDRPDLEARVEALADRWDAENDADSPNDAWNEGYDSRALSDIAALRSLLDDEGLLA